MRYKDFQRLALASGERRKQLNGLMGSAYQVAANEFDAIAAWNVHAKRRSK
jgi:hypothetical protein